jgi:hypothetical protein
MPYQRVHELLGVLAELFPAAFSRPRPLKCGITFDITAALHELDLEFSEEEVCAAMRHHVGTLEYLAACCNEGAPRVDLHGKIIGAVSEWEKLYAADQFEARAKRIDEELRRLVNIAKGSVSFGEWKARCPYGKSTLVDGREMLFNRWYDSILVRVPGAAATAPDPDDLRVNNFPDKDVYYFNDASSPWNSFVPKKVRDETKARCNKVLKEWGADPLPPSWRRGSRPDDDRDAREIGLRELQRRSRPVMIGCELAM